MSDNVNHPSHYQGKVECIDALEAATEGLAGIEAFCTANAIKYLWRWKRKNGTEDLRKALWYLEHLIEKRTTTEATESARSADEALRTRNRQEASFGKVDDFVHQAGEGDGHAYCGRKDNRKHGTMVDCPDCLAILFRPRPGGGR